MIIIVVIIVVIMIAITVIVLIIIRIARITTIATTIVCAQYAFGRAKVLGMHWMFLMVWLGPCFLQAKIRVDIHCLKIPQAR